MISLLSLLTLLLGCQPDPKPGDAPPSATDTCPAAVDTTTVPDTDTPVPTTPMETGAAPVVCGKLAWVVQLASYSEDGVAGVEPTPDGGLVVAGTYAGELTLGYGGPAETHLAEYCVGWNDEMYLAKYATDGTLQWVTRAGGCTSVTPVGVAVRPDGDIIVVGYYWATATFGIGEPAETVLPSDGAQDKRLFLARYAPDGSLRWATWWDGYRFEDAVNDLALGADGSIYATGSFQDTMLFGAGTPQEYTLVGTPSEDLNGNDDIWVAAWNEDGSFRWARSEGGAPTVEHGDAVVEVGDEVLVGSFVKEATTFGVGTPAAAELAPSVGHLLAWSRYRAADGTFVSAALRAGEVADLALTQGDVLEAGEGASTPIVLGEGEPHETTLASLSDLYLARYAPDGALEWATQPLELGPGLSHATQVEVSDVLAGVSGHYQYRLDFDADHAFVAAGEKDAFAATWRVSDGAFQCAWALGGPDTDDATAVALDAQGGVVVAGTFRGTLVIEDGKPERTTLTADNQSTDVFLVRYAP